VENQLLGAQVKIFWTDPILERRVDALSEIGWGAYLCGELLQIDLARSEGFLEGVLKVARTMCGRPVAPALRATMVSGGSRGVYLSRRQLTDSTR
jgi:hypothetical protein